MRRFASIFAISVLTVGAVSMPAHAADSVDDFATLQSAAATCPAGDSTAQLSANIVDIFSVLDVQCDLIIDVAGWNLTLRGIDVGAERHLTLTDSVGGGNVSLDSSWGVTARAALSVTNASLTIEGDITVTATGSLYGAGIGGSLNNDAGTITIRGNATVTATSGQFGAGIGGGYYGNGGTITIGESASVTATSSTSGAGIGGGYNNDNDGGTITIDGNASVTATSNQRGAGIGGGRLGSGGAITIGGNAAITASGGDGGAGIGGGQFGGGGNITIGDSATITATGDNDGAGIGGGYFGDGGTIAITGSTSVIATGGGTSAGIGGGNSGNGGTITIGGSATVNASGGDQGAGIGGGILGSGGTITIEESALVTANSGDDGAGIGGGQFGSGGVVAIGPGSTVTASGGRTAVGPGLASGTFGSLLLEGTLHVPSGNLVIPNSDADFTIAPTGLLLGIDGDETSGASVSGSGGITNNGVIALNSSLVGVSVANNNYLVDFDTQGGTDPAPVRVFAPSFDNSYRALPAPPVDLYWNTSADSTGTWFTETTALTADTTLYAAPPIAETLDLTAPTTTVDEGESVTFTVDAFDHLGNPADASGVVLTSSVDSDIIDGLTVTFPTASPHTITATLGELSSSVTVEVTPVIQDVDDTGDTEDAADEPELADTGVASIQVAGGVALAIILLGTALIMIARRSRALV